MEKLLFHSFHEMNFPFVRSQYCSLSLIYSTDEISIVYPLFILLILFFFFLSFFLPSFFSPSLLPPILELVPRSIDFLFLLSVSYTLITYKGSQAWSVCLPYPHSASIVSYRTLCYQEKILTFLLIEFLTLKKVRDLTSIMRSSAYKFFFFRKPNVDNTLAPSGFTKFFSMFTFLQ